MGTGLFRRQTSTNNPSLGSFWRLGTSTQMASRTWPRTRAAMGFQFISGAAAETFNFAEALTRATTYCPWQWAISTGMACLTWLWTTVITSWLRWAMGTVA